MKALATLILLLGIAANAAFFAWQLKAPAKTSMAAYSSNMLVMRTAGGLLEVSTVAAEERFDSTTTHTVLGVDVGKTVAQVRVPALYRYHIALAKDWNIRISGNAVIVIAPPVSPSLPVAIDTAKLESFSSGLWSAMTGNAAVAELQKSITSTLAAKAAKPDMITLQRESARQTVSEFVQKWVVQQPKWQGAKAPTVLVFFADEPLGKSAAPILLEAQ